MSAMLGQDSLKSLFVLLDAGAARRARADQDRKNVGPAESVVVDFVPEPGVEDFVPEPTDQVTGSEI